MDFINFSNLSSHLKNPNSFVTEVMEELHMTETKKDILELIHTSICKKECGVIMRNNWARGYLGMRTLRGKKVKKLSSDVSSALRHKWIPACMG